MKVVKMMAMAGALLAAGAAFAADGDKANQEGERPAPQAREGMRGPRNEMRPLMGPGMDMNGNWVSRFLMQDENLEKLGLDEAVRKKLKAELTTINDKTRELQEKIRAAGMEQAKMMREVMETPGADMAPVFAKVKEIGDMRTEQSLLSTKVLAVMRDNLTKEQHASMRELIMQEGRQRMEARREFNGNMERRRPQFEGRRRNGEGRNGEGRNGEGRRRRAPEGGEQAAKPDNKE